MRVHFRETIGEVSESKVRGQDRVRDVPDSLAEMDAHAGEILDAIDELRIRDNTIVVFTSDNGPEATWPWQGSSGPWRGYYFTHMEGSLRVPFIIRWPGHITTGRVSNEIVHEVDTYTTFASIAGAPIPQDRPIDGVDQMDFFLGKYDKSNREGFPVFVADRLEAVKWRNWKVAFYDEQRDWWTPPLKLGTPKAFDLITEPKEEYPEAAPRNTWNAAPVMKIVVEFEQSLKRYPPIAPGPRTPTPHQVRTVASPKRNETYGARDFGQSTHALSGPVDSALCTLRSGSAATSGGNTDGGHAIRTYASTRF